MEKGINVKHGVGKVFQSANAFEDEHKVQELLREIDPQGEFTLPIITTCTTAGKYRKTDNVDDCTLIESEHGRSYKQIIMEYGGTKNLNSVFARKTISTALFLKLFLCLESLFQGLVTLKKNKIIHQDIKPDNIMYKNGRLHLIDFGIMTHFNSFFSDKNNVIVADYPYFPPEYKLYARKQKSADHFAMDFLNNFMFTIFVGGRPINIPRILQSALGINIERELFAMYNEFRLKNPKKKMLDRIDTYQLGIILFMMYIAANLTSYEPARKSKKAWFVAEVRVLITKMIHPNVFKRYNAEDAYKHYKRIVGEL